MHTKELAYRPADRVAAVQVSQEVCLADLAESGRLRVRLQATLDLAEAAKAHELLESGSVTGKIALTV